MRRSGPAQRAGDRRAVAHVDSVGDGAALDNSLELMRQGHRHPYAAVGVQADAVGRPVESVGEEPAIAQRSVGADGERRQPSTDRLGDDQRGAVRRDHHSVGEVEVLGDDGDRVVGIDPRDHAALTRLGSDIRAPCVVDDHVAQVRRHEVGQIGDRGRRCLRRSAAPGGSRWTRSAVSPSGRNPSPDGWWPVSGRVVCSPRRLTVCTASPSMSENHSSPSNHRGPSPKQKPSASVVSVSAPLQITP